MILRQYQVEMLQRIKSRFDAGVNRQLVQAATGLGKTAAFAALPDFLKLSGKMMVVVNREELAIQAADKLRQWNPHRSIGVEMANLRTSHAHDLVVASVQTLGRPNNARLKQFDPTEFEAIIWDEAHYCVAPSYKAMFNYFDVFQNKKILSCGFTATPKRADGKGLREVFEEIVYTFSLLDGIRQGWLADLRGKKLKTQTSLDGIHTSMGDYALDELMGRVNTPQRNDLIARAWLDEAENRQTLAFTGDIQHAKDLAEVFKHYGVAADAVWGNDPLRHVKVQKLRDGAIKVLCNCALLTTGFDLWSVGCVLMARPTRSETLYVQCIGRGTRIPAGISNLVEARNQGVAIAKQDCILLDVVDVTSKHSLCTLPTLFGLNQDLDLRGRKISEVMDELASLRSKTPAMSFSGLLDIHKLKGFVEDVELFKDGFTAEVVRLSKYKWHYVDETYVLQLLRNETVRLHQNFIEQWNVVGTINSERIRKTFESFDEAIRWSDNKIESVLEELHLKLLRRGSNWHASDPSQEQLRLAQAWNVPVTTHTSAGELTEAFAGRIAMDFMGTRRYRPSSESGQITYEICPNCKDTHYQFYLQLNGRTAGSWYCLACEAHGGLFDLTSLTIKRSSD